MSQKGMKNKADHFGTLEVIELDIATKNGKRSIFALFVKIIFATAHKHRHDNQCTCFAILQSF